MRTALALFLAGSTLLVSACDRRPTQWDAFIYPDKNDLDRVERIAGFKTFELCRQAALNRLRSIKDEDEGFFECGYKCAVDERFDMNVCKETRD